MCCARSMDPNVLSSSRLQTSVSFRLLRESQAPRSMSSKPTSRRTLIVRRLFSGPGMSSSSLRSGSTQPHRWEQAASRSTSSSATSRRGMQAEEMCMAIATFKRMKRDDGTLQRSHRRSEACPGPFVASISSVLATSSRIKHSGSDARVSDPAPADQGERWWARPFALLLASIRRWSPSGKGSHDAAWSLRDARLPTRYQKGADNVDARLRHLLLVVLRRMGPSGSSRGESAAAGMSE